MQLVIVKSTLAQPVMDPSQADAPKSDDSNHDDTLNVYVLGP